MRSLIEAAHFSGIDSNCACVRGCGLTMSKRLTTATVAFVVALLSAPAAHGQQPEGQRPEVVTATLNGLEIAIDGEMGSVVRLSYPGLGTMLEASPECASIVDLAYPVPDFEPLRLASRYSAKAKITKTDTQVVIHWDRLGASRSFVELPGNVAATVTLSAAADGRSVIMSCQIDNRSGHAVRQVLFPDLVGLVPLAGEARTEFRTGGSVVRPFMELRRPVHDAFYSINSTFLTLESGGVQLSTMIARWMDFGSPAGGLSLFPRRWGLDPRATVMLHLGETDQKLRLKVAHSDRLAEGAVWESGQYVLTPHIGGWAKGIEPYRAWARQHIKRVCPVPDHIRKGLGYRTIWMSRAYPKEPQDAVWTFSDLPKLARESKEHGLHEMVLWFIQDYFELPLPPFHPHLGGERELLKAVGECKRMGVNVVPFISVCSVKEKTGARYGIRQFPGNWTYHPEFIPRFTPPYAGAHRCAWADTRHPVWQKEVLASCKRLIDIGIPSLCWDQFLIEPPEPNLLTLTREIRAYARRHDPQSTFSAEELNSLEVSCDYLDYTWNWITDRDVQAITSVFPTPRVNFNIDTSVADVKQGFLQNRFLNVQPRRPDDINGSDLIENHPELSRALKQCARLRAQFLPYFIDGTFIGDCVLSEPCPGAVTAAYVLPDRLLVLVLNTEEAKREIRLRCDLRPWLESSFGEYRVQKYNEDGKPLGTSRVLQADMRPRPFLLEHLGLCLFDITPEQRVTCRRRSKSGMPGG